MMALNSRFVPNAKLETEDQRLLKLFDQVVSRIPTDIAPVSTVTAVRARRRGRIVGLAGLTHWKYGAPRGRQTITFYTALLDQLSDLAYAGIIAHELAHAWLNEHAVPAESERRETETDELVRRWGFGNELSALEEETEPVSESILSPSYS